MQNDVDVTPKHGAANPDIKNFTRSEHYTFWRQLLDHPTLHALVFVLATVIYALVGEVITFFSFTVPVAVFSVVVGFIALQSFVDDELDRQRIIAGERARNGNPLISLPGSSDIDDVRWDQYSYLEQKMIELSILTSRSYVLRLFYDRTKWTIVTIFQIATTMTLTIVLTAIHVWIFHPTTIHTDVVFWLKTGDDHSLTSMLSQWIGVGALLILFLVVYKWLFDKFPSGREVLKKSILEKSQTDR